MYQLFSIFLSISGYILRQTQLNLFSQEAVPGEIEPPSDTDEEDDTTLLEDEEVIYSLDDDKPRIFESPRVANIEQLLR